MFSDYLNLDMLLSSHMHAKPIKRTKESLKRPRKKCSRQFNGVEALVVLYPVYN